MAGDTRDHYQVLGVRPGASADEIRRSHRQLAHLLHPDRQAGATPGERALAERRMREINAAWTVLSDPTRRAEYDRTLRAGSSRPQGATGTSRPPGPPAGAVDLEEEDPDEAWARARLADVDPDEPDLGAAHFWLLRRGPVVLVLVLAVVLFLFTALARGGGPAQEDAARTDAPPPLAPSSACVARQADGSLRTVGCEFDHVAIIELDGVSSQRACRAGEVFARLNTNEGVCLRTLAGWDAAPEGS